MRWLFSNPARIDHARVVAAIADAERQTSGEIRVLVARHRTQDPVPAAHRQFERLGLGGVSHPRAVLIFVSPRSRRFAVVGSKAVHDACGDAFWGELAAAMGVYFKRGEFTAGLVHGIERAGTLLAAHFPPQGA
jgi:uncharacterized membrane protein